MHDSLYTDYNNYILYSGVQAIDYSREPNSMETKCTRTICNLRVYECVIFQIQVFAKTRKPLSGRWTNDSLQYISVQ